MGMFDLLFWVELGVAALFGLILSWLSNRWVSRRLSGESFFKPLNATCMACRQGLPWKEQLPIVGPILVGGRCPQCGASHRVTLRLLDALMVLAPVFCVGIDRGVGWVIGLSLFFMIAAIDWETRRIPRALSYPLLALGVLGMSKYGDRTFLVVMAAVGAYATLMTLRIMGQAWLKREVLGLGDVLMSAIVVVWFGAINGLLGIGLGVVLAGIVALLGIKMGRFRRKDHIPLAPFMITGVALVWVGFYVINGLGKLI